MIKKAKIVLNGDVQHWRKVKNIIETSGLFGEVEIGFKPCHKSIVLVDSEEDGVHNEWWLDTKDDPNVPNIFKFLFNFLMDIIN